MTISFKYAHVFFQPLFSRTGILNPKLEHFSTYKKIRILPFIDIF